ncbi:putative protein OS=Tsukamurella paurometabola (strain ATCC 8368 / DSM / CCUG 35730 /CIP 100753 / JCM 10117 / KCTC 9821 / NBRC 16120 / NCIMB 702349/ NCTC 13040) OX=521096 GN=Tpau_1428 PE=4 SV=1 [Tsukamurella paurometabola]|uniref:Uncharacterized protein n=1 Tax=Tsukamurella paurometabola (strain ATCC 8368 / DSM 20162 / CCUG 35730 / CIP 100753 / JCM 10117 / KCTC 9821 / NBRC 16120 / NCIMB 702349 / NCTC 13040) TaxID=521096 RepID=D5UXG4_TSUPD|nr:hypothetical protein [Tsukamurella paurometabola]ADG78056.1 hypothetical protein Tpau_1428 [Tsukamurella paurometabola DSM 20162]SUP29973.1 Uncharacterised protein [Tsukamurella paurometabola]
MTIAPRDYYRDLTPGERTEVDQIVASHIQPTGPGWDDIPSGSAGHMPWLDDLIRAERPNHGYPDDAKWWAYLSGLTEFSYHSVIPMPGAEEFLARVLDGAPGGHELIILSERMPSFIQHQPFPLEYRSDEFYEKQSEVVKRCSFVIIPGETPAKAAERIARKHIKPHHYFGSACVFSGSDAPKPCGDHDNHPANHPPSHEAHKLALFRRGSVFWALPVCDECLWGSLSFRGWGRKYLDRANQRGLSVTKWHMGGGLVDDLEAHGERAVIVDYTSDPGNAPR